MFKERLRASVYSSNIAKYNERWDKRAEKSCEMPIIAPMELQHARNNDVARSHNSHKKEVEYPIKVLFSTTTSSNIIKVYGFIKDVNWFGTEIKILVMLCL